MDKREDEFFETDELPEIPETLKGEPKDENEAAAEEKDEKTEDMPDLSGFLDENTEIDSIADIDPELDKALSEFSDDGNETAQDDKKEVREEIEREIKEKISQENAKKVKFIKKVTLVCLLAVVLIGGGLFALLMLDNISNGYIMTFENKKISMEEFKFYLLMSQESYTPKEDALNGLKEFLVLEKAAKDRSIILSQEEKDNLKEYINYVITSYGVPLDMLKIKEERLIEMFSLDYIYYTLWDKVAEEKNFTVDEAAFAEELKNYKAEKHDYVDLDLKYIITETKEEADEAKAALTADSSVSSIEETIKKYSVDYNEEYGIETIQFSQIGVLNNEQTEHLLSLKVSEISEVMDIDGQFYLIFIIENIIMPTAEEITEIEDSYKNNYIDYQKYQLFMVEFEEWKNETKIIVNEKAFDKFDLDKFWGKFFAG